MAERNPKFKLKKFNLSPQSFVLITSVVYEFLLHILTLESFNFVRLLCVVLLSGFFAMFAGFFCTLSKKYKTNRIIAVTLVSIYGVILLIEYFVNDAFTTFMPFSSIFSGAGDVADDYFVNILKAIWGGLWCILLFSLPIIVYLLFTPSVPTVKFNTKGIKKRWLILSAMLLVLCLPFTFAFSPDTEKLRSEYNFDSAVKGFGLTAGMLADTFNGIFPPKTDFEDVGNLEQKPPIKEEDIVYGENKLDIDFESLIANANNSSLSNMHEYVSSLTPSSKNKYTGMFKGKNLIFITAEAFSAEVIDKDLTPTLYRLANKGIKFTDYYQPAWGGSTSTGEYSNVIGLIPVNGVNSMKQTVGKNMYMTMGNQLRRIGYNSVAYHNNTYTYYDRHKTHENLGYDKFIGMGNGMEQGVKNTWPQSDKQMMDFTVSQYIDKQPFSVYYMTVSGHCNYSLIGNYISKQNFDKVKDLPYSEDIKCYLAANLELEYGLQSLVKQLEDAGIADDTVIVISTDHYPYGLTKSGTWGTSVDRLEELYGYKANDCFKRDHSALIIWSGSIEDKNIEVTTPTYSLDIVPTLSNLFGLEYDSRLLVGRDVFSNQMPLAIWADYSWKTDKGSYNSSTKEFIANEGVTVDEDYVESIKAIVRNKFKFSKYVLENDYYAKVFK